ncbi:MAG: PDZ domain-containing protein [Pseudomonadales bacterium]|jgi:predicted metalloprotease with PDZ domain|nr:PDZ domain-containing protein [Pseudomonadales bacterium]
MLRVLSPLLLLFAVVAEAAPRTVYELGLDRRASQELEVTVRFEEVPGTTVDFHLPVWRTGLYLVLDPVGTVSDVTVTDVRGEALPVERTASSSWRVTRPEAAPGTVVVRYLVYANSLEDRTRHVDADHAFVNPGTVFVYADALRDAPVEVRVDLPRNWKLASGMDSPGRGRLVAPHYDRLVDSPIEAGTFDLVRFEAAGIDVEFLIHGIWDGDAERLEEEVSAIVEAAAEIFEGDVPTDRYLFLLHSLPGLGGGTEYYNSTVVHTDPRSWWDEDRHERFLSLLAHEFFHLWNVKRFRPAEIARYDYQAENYTELLWVNEGLTSYYDQLLLARAGLIDLEDYREVLAETIDDVVDRPGYGRQSLSEASFEAWVRGYHRGADRVPDKPNRTVSFYAQGGLLGLVLDLELRAATGGEASLDVLMRRLYADFPLGGPGFTYADLRARVAELGGEAIAERLDRWSGSTDPLPLAEALARVGWTLEREEPDDDEPTAALGVTLREAQGRIRVTQVALGTPAHAAGVNAGDRLVALDGAEVTGADLDPLLLRHAPGDRVELALFRDGRLRTVEVELYAPLGPHELEVDEEASEDAVALRAAWLGPRAEEDEEEEEEDEGEDD